MEEDELQVEATYRFRARYPAEHFAGDRIGAILEHPLELLRGHRLPDDNTKTVVQSDESGSEKDPRGSAGFAVIAKQVRLGGAFRTVVHGDGFEQVLVPRSMLRRRIVIMLNAPALFTTVAIGRPLTSSARRVRQKIEMGAEGRESKRNEG